MGKARRNRVRARDNADPLSAPSKPPADPELAALREQKILPVLKELRNPDAQARLTAANAIYGLLADDKCRRLLLREQLLRLLIKDSLADSNPEVRATAWDIIKNVAEKEDSGFCIHLYRQDILPAIEFAADTLSETLQSTQIPFETTTKAQQSIVWKIATAICSLLGALGEAQEDILQAITNSDKISKLLLGLLAREIIDPDTLDECLSCTMTLTEDNPPLAEALASSPAFDLLMKLKNLDGSTSILVCGVLHNVFAALEWNDASPGKDGATDEILVRRLARTIQDYRSAGQTSEWVAPDEIATLALEILASIASTIQETLAGGPRHGPGDEEMGDDIMEEDEDEDEGDNDDDELPSDMEGSDDDDMDDDEMIEDMELVTGADDDDGISNLPTLEAFLSKALPQVLKLASPSLQGQASPEIQVHAVSVLNNLSWSLACVEFTDDQSEGLFKAWVAPGRDIWTLVVNEILDSDTNDLALATEVTSLAWAVAKALGAKLPLGEGHHQKFIALYQATKNMMASDDQNGGDAPGAEDPFQSLGVKCIGALAQLARDPAPLALNRDIGVFLVTVIGALPETAPAEAVEALNQLFDIYSDEDSEGDKVFWQDNFLKHLEAALPKTRKMLKGIHKNEPRLKELRDRTEEVVMNLERFIQYKKKNAPS
ncbi:unnamed protein product [Parascedosporium putredinis]|uniref:SYO1-like TPR repeats domain-containing protein n=1 Tax=Parascedosporium putredinis TaxID=1442378 RepID=A0A9P1H2L6_9PEZI|nr:unnamed protein product [Parascedosporium putredinis]CAI7995020.1 unnamed protein product [Parascedosporium putredinis]